MLPSHVVRVLCCLVALAVFPGAAHAQGDRRQVIKSPDVQADGTVTFRLRAPNAEKVSLVSGEMEAAIGKAPKPLVKNADGLWTLTVGPLASGIYDYSFDVDGLRITDPSSPDVFNNRQGSRGYVEVPSPPGQHRADEWRDVPHGSVTIQWYDSKSTGRRRRVHVYTPPGYEQGAKKYPVLYLLHGSGDNDSHWMLMGRANVIADNLLADGRMQPMVIAMPDGHAYVPADPNEDRDAARAKALRQFEADLVGDVIPLIERTYRVDADRTRRAVTGLSMGGGQSLAVGLKHLDKFAWVGAFSAGTTTAEEALSALAAEPDRANAQLKLLWIKIGEDDFLLQMNRQFVERLTAAGIKHEYEETAGAHRWSVWRRYLAEFLPRLFAD